MSARRLLLGLAALLPLLGPGAVRAQGILQLDPLRGDVTLDFNGYSWNSQGSPGSSTNVLRESLGVRLGGAVISPRLVGFDLSLRPALTQGRWATGEASDTGHRTNLYGSGQLRLLNGFPVSMWARVHRSRDEFSGLYGQETRSDTEGFGVGANFTSRYLSANLSYNENSSDALWSSPTSDLTRRVQDRNQFTLNVTNSKTRVRFDRLEVEDQARPVGLRRSTTSATNRQRWGKGSTLLSRFYYTDQEGAGAVESLLWGQNARLQHTRQIATDLRYSLTDVKSPGERVRGWTTGIHESVRLSPRLAFLLDGSGSRQSASVGTVQNWRIQPGVRANARLHGGLRLGAGASVGYRWRNQETGEGGTRTVIGEEHVVPAAGRFLLDELEPDPTTVQVTNEDGTLLYEPDADYRLFATGSLLEVVVLPGGRIATGETVLVDYEHRVFGSSSSELLSWSYGLDLQWRGLQVYHSLSADDRVSSTNPDDPNTGDNRNAIAGVRFQSATPVGALTLNGEWRETSLGQENTELILLDADLGYTISDRWRGTAGAGWSTRRDGVRYDLVRAFARVQWRAMRTIQAYADLSANAWDRVDQDETYLGLAVGADWTVGLLTVGARFERRHIDSGTLRVQNRLQLRASRKF